MADGGTPGSLVLTLLLGPHDVDDLANIFTFLRDHVQGVNNVIQGQATSLVDFRKMVDYPVEGYKLIVLSTDISMFDEHLQNQLKK